MSNIINRNVSESMFLPTIFLLGFLCFSNFLGSAQTLQTLPSTNGNPSEGSLNTIQSLETEPIQQMPNIPAIAVSTDNIARRTLSCDVVFGSSPTTCNGKGICKISAHTSRSQTALEQKQGCHSTLGMQSQIEDGKGVSLLLSQDLLCPQFYKTHLRNGLLIQESPCKLSKEVIEILGLKINVLPIGEYPVQEANGYLRIDFRIPDTKK